MSSLQYLNGVAPGGASRLQAIIAIVATIVIMIVFVLAIMRQLKNRAAIVVAVAAVVIAIIALLFAFLPDIFFVCMGPLAFLAMAGCGYAVSTLLPKGLKPIVIWGGVIIGLVLMGLLFSFSPLYAWGQTPIFPTPLPASVPTSMQEAIQSQSQQAAAVLPVPTSSVTLASSCVNQGSFVGDITIPDKTILTPGFAFVKTWRIKNTGTCAWGTGYSLVPLGGSLMGGVTTGIGKTVFSGETVDLTVNLVAPDGPQLYRGEWGMQNAKGEIFPISKADGKIWVEIIVLPPTPRP